ncbi:hypothetical protein [Auritidibacter ignavus]|uniref:hypothetical protein n=1 Tax=Auritidibacter ignavus TaxID=678932 RepID=UPI00141ABDC4|nr:hypothetical protein [Auritidibacter ignavus]
MSPRLLPGSLGEVPYQCEAPMHNWEPVTVKAGGDDAKTNDIGDKPAPNSAVKYTPDAPKDFL